MTNSNEVKATKAAIETHGKFIKDCYGICKEFHWKQGERGKGYASVLLEKAKRCFPSLIAFLDDDGTGLTVDQMREWYKRHGFKQGKWDLGRIGNIKKVMMWESDLLIDNATK